MNSILRASLGIKCAKELLNHMKRALPANVGSQRQLARNLWHLSNIRNEGFRTPILKEPSNLCSCGCGGRGTHSKAERELVEFLTEEIVAERKAQKSKVIPTEIDGFKVCLDGAEVTLVKEGNDEKINVTFNVNHTVDSEVEPEVDMNADKPEIGDLKSKPAFKVDIIKGSTTLTLNCSFINANEQDEEYNDIFGVDELSIYQGSWNENVYAVAGEVMDSCLYDLLLNYLEEKGVTNEFVEKMSSLSTAYEHAAYIGLLEGLSKFAIGKQ